MITVKMSFMNSKRGDKRTKRSIQILWPGHNYLGPGNKVYNGLPVDDADWTALDHDIAYSKAKNNDDVRIADKIAIENFAKKNSLANLAGYYGLKIKSGIENYTGVLYPRKFNKEENSKFNVLKRHRGDDMFRKDGKPFNKGNYLYAARQYEKAEKRRQELAGASTSKKSKADSSTPEEEDQIEEPEYNSPQPSPVISENMSQSNVMDVEMIEARDGTPHQGGGPVNAANSSSSIHGGSNVKMPRELSLKQTVTYHKEFTMTSWANAYTKLEVTVKHNATQQGNSTKYELLSTPLACLPANMLCLYMSKAQFLMLPPFALAKKASIKVTPIGYRCAFSAGSSTSSFANSAHSIFGVKGIGLNKKIYGTHKQIAERNATNPMIPTSLSDCTFNSMETRIWATKTDASGNSTVLDINDVPVISGVQRTMPYYYMMYLPKNNFGYQILTKETEEFDYIGSLYKPIIEYEHNFKNGILKCPGSLFPVYKEDAVGKQYGGYNLRNKSRGNKFKATVNSKGQISQLDTERTTRFSRSAGFTYIQDIEKPFLSNAATNEQIEIPPFVYFGVQPIQANTPLTSTDYTNCQGIFKIETQLEVELNLDADFVNTIDRYAYKELSMGVIKDCESTLNNINTFGLYEE